jgi:lysophospholipase L1-like esterase
MIRVIIIFLFSFVSGLINCQEGDYFIGQPKYPFIHYDDAKLILPPDDVQIEKLFDKFDSLILYGNGKINIVHIGGSHIQADVYTHQIRKRLQTLQLDMNGGRGFVFPFRMARTNNPSNYKVSYIGNWETCKNTEFNRICPLGLSGMSVSTSDKFASISINPNNDPEINYSFTRVKVFHNLTHYKLSLITDDSVYCGYYDSIGGFSQFKIPESWIMKLQLRQADSLNESISIFGFSLENDNPGVVYSAIGVNGARLNSYINCQFYSQQLATLNPDLIIFSIGTNDANTRDFNPEQYKIEYEQLIAISKMAAPNAVVLITVPNDCYLYKRYVNKNTAEMRDEILALAEKENCCVWDFYSVMGGLNSSQSWYNNGLMNYDRIHFSKEGYIIKGDLFITAFLRAWEKNLARRTEKIICPGNNPGISNPLVIGK